MADAATIQAMLDAHLKKIDEKFEAKFTGLAATVGIQGQMLKTFSDRMEKLEARMDALEQTMQMNASRLPISHATLGMGGKRRAVDSVGDGSTTGGGGGSVLEDAHRLLILGFQDRLMAASLETVAKDIIAQCATEQAASLIRARAYDLQKKVTLDFLTPAMASYFQINLRKLSET